MMGKYTVAITEELERRLEAEGKRWALDTIPEVMRTLCSEALAKT
jgi:hypothetical protein